MGLFNDLLGIPAPKRKKRYTGKKKVSSTRKVANALGRQKKWELQRRLNKAKAKAKYSEKNRKAYFELQRAIQNS